MKDIYSISVAKYAIELIQWEINLYNASEKCS